ncbi:MAG: class I SAM-dependent methyltransferase [Gammaproteobacteria bacterium]|jgi:SAM-dependent methyltransferase
MQRVTEPELMDDPLQAVAYAAADFDEPHRHIVASFDTCFPQVQLAGTMLDLGCGPGDVSFRFAARFPACSVIGVDGSAAMIRLANRRRAHAGELQERVRFIEGVIPGAAIPAIPYAAIVSNSLLHHLHDPRVLWETVVRYAGAGSRIYIADLLRPQSEVRARDLVTRYAGGEPEVLQRDFYHSLCAAFEPREVVVQLAAAGLGELAVKVISDRHLVVCGTRN